MTDAKLVAELKAVMDWGDKPQPKGALIQHHGIYRNVTDRWELQFTGDVMIFRARTARWVNGDWKNPITPKEAEWLVAIMRKATGKDVPRWNGEGQDSMSFQANRMGKGIGSLVETYNKGCPKKGRLTGKDKIAAKGGLHHNRTGKHDTGSAFCGCGWFKEGYEKAKFPEGWE